jgi:(4-(4-[2-(gamma-L-glutamylamino)ethyl]phenoxymethyl)furan-2-yl)methanamine synthase
MEVIGWDIGGVNTKVARVTDGVVRAACGRPYELQRDPGALAPLLRALAGEIGGDAEPAHAVTMTAELSQMFRTKREGVSFVLAAVEAAFPSALVRVYAVDGRFLTAGQARRDPLAVASANWSATARAIAAHHPDALLVDIGTTTTDIIPIVGGTVAAGGCTDPERLASGELVYTGALRTPAEAIASQVAVAGTAAGVSAEGFALAGDVHVWRGNLDPADYTCPTPDGRPATREFAGERIARVVCGDRELLDHAAVSSIADALADAQVARIAAAIARVRARHPLLRTAVVTGLGAFLGAAAADAAGMRVAPLAAELGEAGARCAPAVAVALLLERVLTRANRADLKVRTTTEVVQPPSQGSGEPRRSSPDQPASGGGAFGPAVTRALVDTVVKLGGGVLSHAEHFEGALTAIAAAAREHPLLVVPGGGPFADAVREVDRRYGLADVAAHWMAVLAMDQYAHLVVARLAGAVLVEAPAEIAAALGAGRVPVLAPSRWLRAADPLPHSWDVTSDSLAAWIAGVAGASRLVLIKPPGASGQVVDAYFSGTLPPSVTSVIVTADHMDELRSALSRSA